MGKAEDAIKDFYKLLGLGKDASDEDIKKAYRAMAKKFHPDKNQDDGAEEKFKEIAAAYETLKDAHKRRMYDLQKVTEEERARQEQTMERSRQHTGCRGYNTGGTNFTFRSTFSTFDDKDDDASPRHSSYTSRHKKKKNKENGGTQHSSFFSRPEWDNNWNGTEQRRSTESPFSFTFNFFRSPEFEDYDPFAGIHHLFDDFFSDAFFKKWGSEGSTFCGASTNANGFTFSTGGSAPKVSVKSTSNASNHGNATTQRKTLAQKEAERRGEAAMMYDWSTPPWQASRKDSTAPEVEDIGNMW